ncbi:MAG: hypothetical protein K0S96_1974, partial [Geminicoccaceae bacterium]|nr:hypothetical protein [Geminicoccaceae bacterium]
VETGNLPNSRVKLPLGRLGARQILERGDDSRDYRIVLGPEFAVDGERAGIGV